MSISVFDLFSIGVGPSSSHTVGPMLAANQFAKAALSQCDQHSKLTVELYGSLALTGVGHGTDNAILVGLEGSDPETVDPAQIYTQVAKIKQHKQLSLSGSLPIEFDFSTQLLWHYTESLPLHSNGMRFTLTDAANKVILRKIIYSIGGGFIATDEELLNPQPTQDNIPYPFETAQELFAHCAKNHLRIDQVMMANELTWRKEVEINARVLNIAEIMQDCIFTGCKTNGVLPGGLKVKRRAPDLYQKLQTSQNDSLHHTDVLNWINVYAIAVNEQNAAGGRVVTAPTNGASGIIPAVLQYYKEFCEGVSNDKIIMFLLTAGAIAILYKKQASISGAEMGCQGEVGVACSMAAAALTAVLGGTLEQIENAAEIAMEHNLGLTCDPIKGLVQIPCIERNAMGAVKAINASSLALAEQRRGVVSLDEVIATMREIGQNMNSIYKETSLGGLAVNVAEC